MIFIKPNEIKYNKEKLNDFEEVIGFKLPKEYIEFLKKSNGGIPEENVIELHNEEIQSISITDFFGIGVEKINDLKEQFEVFKDRIPKGYIPIASVEGGNIICMYCPNGSIFLWDHDSELLNENVVKFEPLIPIAKNFEEFLNMIKPFNTEEDLDGYKVEEVWIDPEFLKELEGDNKD